MKTNNFRIKLVSYMVAIIVGMVLLPVCCADYISKIIYRKGI